MAVNDGQAIHRCRADMKRQRSGLLKNAEKTITIICFKGNRSYNKTAANNRKETTVILRTREERMIGKYSIQRTH